MPEETDFTELLSAYRQGDARAADRLMPRVYDELRQLAEAAMRRERADHTLQATALVHEAYLRLVDQSRIDWQSETHFRAVAAEAMRRLLIDHARHHKREKRGGGWRRVAIESASAQGVSDAPSSTEADVEDLYEAMERMRALDERQCRVVELRLFGGLSFDAIAELLGISRRTAERDWTMGRAWLRKELRDEEQEPT